MDGTALHGVDSSGIDAGMAENIGKSDDVPFNAIVSPCKQVPQIMRKYLFSAHPRGCAELFHFCPDVAAVYGIPAGRNEDAPLPDFLLTGIFQ